MTPHPVCSHLGIPPDIHPSVYVAPGAVVLGNVVIGARSSIWYQCVLRADIERITIGSESNIQDGAVVHLSSELGTHVGDRVTVGHKAILHACSVGDEVLVGMGSVIMDGVRIGPRSIVAAGTLVPKGREIPPGSLVMGSPGRVVRSLSLDEQQEIRLWAEKYVRVAAEHRAHHSSSVSP